MTERKEEKREKNFELLKFCLVTEEKRSSQFLRKF